MLNRDQVIQILKQHHQELVERYPIESLSLFGSVARDEARPESDVDLLVEFSQPVGLFQFVELQQYLESILGVKVDLGTKRSLKAVIKNRVLEESIRVA